MTSSCSIIELDYDSFVELSLVPSHLLSLVPVWPLHDQSSSVCRRVRSTFELGLGTKLGLLTGFSILYQAWFVFDLCFILVIRDHLAIQRRGVWYLDFRGSVGQVSLNSQVKK